MYGRGEDVVRLRFRSVSRDTLGFGCVCVHICSHHHTFVQARALALTYLQSGVECPNFFIFASLSLNVVVGVRVDVFLFFVCQVSKALYFQKGQNTRFRVQSHSRTRALSTTTTTRFGRRRRHMASSSSSSSRVVVVVVFCADGANCRSLEIDRSMNIFMSREFGGQKQGWRLRISKIICTKKKKNI